MDATKIRQLLDIIEITVFFMGIDDCKIIFLKKVNICQLYLRLPLNLMQITSKFKHKF